MGQTSIRCNSWRGMWHGVWADVCKSTCFGALQMLRTLGAAAHSATPRTKSNPAWHGPSLAGWLTKLYRYSEDGYCDCYTGCATYWEWPIPRFRPSLEEC